MRAAYFAFREGGDQYLGRTLRTRATNVLLLTVVTYGREWRVVCGGRGAVGFWVGGRCRFSGSTEVATPPQVATYKEKPISFPP